MLPHRLHRVVLGTLVVGGTALALVGCGSDSSSDSSGSSTPPPAATPTSTTPAPTTTETNATGGATAGASTVEIDMVDLKFAPAGATVQVGGKVTWTNQDDAPHNVVSNDGTIKSSNFGKGESFTWTAVKSGVISYSCTLHPGMVGTLSVQ